MGAIHTEPSDARRRVGNSRFSKEYGSKVKKDWEGNQPTAEKKNKSNQSQSGEQSMEEGNTEQGEAKTPCRNLRISSTFLQNITIMKHSITSAENCYKT